jgi:hypothetical protein
MSEKYVSDRRMRKITKFPACRQAGKHQIPNNVQISMTRTLIVRILENWNLFEIWDLIIGFSFKECH